MWGETDGMRGEADSGHWQTQGRWGEDNDLGATAWFGLAGAFQARAFIFSSDFFGGGQCCGADEESPAYLDVEIFRKDFIVDDAE
jgi:hypothetical protein